MAPEEATESTVGLPVGEKIGKYEIREKLGTGGQAIVYKCYDAMLDRFVAIKQISSHLAEDPKFLDRFRKEAQILAKLGAEQPAVVTIHELLEEPQGLFIVMEFVEGHTLERILRENPNAIEPKATLQILWRLAAALHVVHNAGIIHRDIKPGNIIIGEGLRAKITDFGVAASLTGQTSMLLGTTKYMAPELFSGDQADGRVDMYSLGVIAYEMLLGREKFNEIFHDVVRDRHSEALRWMKWHGNLAVTAPPVHTVNPKLPPTLSDIVAKMMAKRPEERFANMEELGRAIKTTFSPRGKGAPARGARRPSRVPVAQVIEPGGGEAAGKGEGGEELELELGGGETAPIPKKRMSLKTKLVLAGVAALTLMALLVILIVRGRQQREELLKVATERYNAAWKLYRNAPGEKTDEKRREAYTEALKRLKQLRKPPFTETVLSTKAYAVIPVCEGYLAVLNGKWQEAQVKHRKAEERLKEVQRRAKPNTDLARFGSDFADDVRRLREHYQNLWDVAYALARAEELFSEGDPAGAVRMVERKLASGQLSPQDEDKCKQFLAKVRQHEFRLAIMKEINRGEEAKGKFLERVKRGQDPQTEQLFDLANTAYDAAMKMTEKPEAKVLDEGELTGLRKRIQEGKNELASKSDRHRLKVLIEEAKTPEEKLKLLKQADSRWPSPEWKTQIKKLEETIAYKAILALIDKGSTARAIVELRKFTRQYPQHPDAAAMLTNLEKNRDWQVLVVKGDQALRGAKYEEAKERFEEARKLRPDPDLDKKIRQCEFHLALAKADDSYAKKDYPAAETRYTNLLHKYPENAAVIQARLVRLQRVVRYLQTLDRARKAIETGHYGEARKILKEISPPTEESKQLGKRSFYVENREKGKAEMDRGQYRSAVAYLNIAKRYAQNPEEVQEIEELLKQANDMERRSSSSSEGTGP